MPDITKTLDSNFSLDELTRTLITQEQLGFLRLAGLTARASPPANVATFKDDPDPNPPSELFIVPIDPGQDLDSIKTAQQGKGRRFLFASTIFVSGNREQVAVFR